jgi:hypothetical protein
MTGDPMTTVRVLVQQTTERETLEQLSDGELLRKAARELLIAVCLVANEIVPKQPWRLPSRPRSASLCGHSRIASRPPLRRSDSGGICQLRSGAPQMPGGVFRQAILER